MHAPLLAPVPVAGISNCSSEHSFPLSPPQHSSARNWHKLATAYTEEKLYCTWTEVDLQRPPSEAPDLRLWAESLCRLGPPTSPQSSLSHIPMAPGV